MRTNIEMRPTVFVPSGTPFERMVEIATAAQSDGRPLRLRRLPSKKENQIDYERRILQWFGHYLKGEPAAPWIVDGMKALDRKAVLDANKESQPPTRP